MPVYLEGVCAWWGLVAQDHHDGPSAEGFGTLLPFEHLPLCIGLTI